MDYQNDQELLFLVNESDENAEKLLINKYKQLINNHIKPYEKILVNIGLERNDLFQEGLIGLHQAIKNYKKEKEVLFYTYANLCIDSSVKGAIRSANRQKFKNLNNSMSLDSLFDDEKSNLYNVLEDKMSDPSIMFIEQESESEVIDLLSKHLTDFESQVFNLKLAGLSNDEIACILHKEKRSIENTLFRIKTKYKNLIL